MHFRLYMGDRTRNNELSAVAHNNLTIFVAIFLLRAVIDLLDWCLLGCEEVIGVDMLV